jgi:plastocyanin
MFGKSVNTMLALGACLTLGLMNVHSAYSAPPAIEVIEQNVIFQSGDIDAKVGQTIRLVNKDPFMHMSQIRKLDQHGIEHDSVAGQAEMPGTSIDLTVNEAGKYKLRCIFHDGMIINVNITE